MTAQQITMDVKLQTKCYSYTSIIIYRGHTPLLLLTTPNGFLRKYVEAYASQPKTNINACLLFKAVSNIFAEKERENKYKN